MIGLLEYRAAMTAQGQATLVTIGANVEMRVRDLRDLTVRGSMHWRGGPPYFFVQGVLNEIRRYFDFDGEDRPA